MTINQNLYGSYDPNQLQGFVTQQTSATKPQSANVKLPDIYYMPDDFKKKKTFKEQVKTVDVMGLVYQWLEHPLLMIGTCLGMSFGIDAIDKSFCKEYEKSSLGKWAKFGDKIEQSKFIQSKPSQKVLKGISSGWKSLKGFLMKSQVIKAMVKTPTSPEWAMPKSELQSGKQRIVEEFRALANQFGLTNAPEETKKGFFKIFKSGVKGTDMIITDSEAAKFKAFYKVENLSKAPQIELKRRIALTKLNVPEAEINNILSSNDAQKLFKSEVIKRAGLTAEEFEMILADTEGKSFELVKKASNNLKNIEFNEGMLEIPKSKVQPLRNRNGFGKIFNKAHSITDGAKTKTGRVMATILQKLHRGFTFGGGKGGVLLFIAPMLLETMFDTIKADRKEKVGTLAQGTIGIGTWVFTFPLILKFIHAYGGMKNAGMSVEKVKLRDNKITGFNKLVEQGHFKSWKDYRNAKKSLKKEIKQLQKVPNQNLLTKICRKFGAFTKADLGKIKSYRSGNFFADTARKLPNFLKDAVYGPGRFLVFMMLFMPAVDKVIEKGLSAIFGKSYDRYKVEENEENKKQQEEFTLKDLKERMLNLQEKKMNPQEEIDVVNNEFKSGSNNIDLTEGFNSLNTDKNLQNDNASIVDNSVNEKKSFNNISNEIKEESPVENEALSETLNTTQNIKEKQNTNPFADQVENTETQNKRNVNDTYTYIPSQSGNIGTNTNMPASKRDNYTYIPSQESVLGNNPSQNVQKYIPAQTAITLDKTFDNSSLNSAMKRADRAEERALKVLAGNFEDM